MYCDSKFKILERYKEANLYKFFKEILILYWEQVKVLAKC